MNLENFFNPETVAVIGASSAKHKVGYSLMTNLLKGKKRKIYPVTLTEKEILGIPAFASILDVPEKVDLAVIAVHSNAVPQILNDCGEKKISHAVIISSGFKEIGPEGRELENQISKIAKERDITLLGPNCLGLIDTKNDFNASFSPQKPLSGKIALLSQSGALGTAMLDWAIGEGVGFSKFISLGNEAQLTEIDFLEYLSEDDNTSSIMVYLEKISDGQKFLHCVSKITKKKPVVVLKAGITSHGLRAVMSHTGSLAPESSVFAGACKQAGAIAVSSLREFFNIAKLLSLGVSANQPVQNLIIVTNGGGPSVVAADLVDNSKSLSLVELSENTKEELKKVLPPMAAVENPIDIIGDALAERYEKTLDVLCEVENVDGIIVMLTPQMMTETEATAQIIAKYKTTTSAKIFPIFMGGPSVQSGRIALIETGLVNFAFPKDVIEALDDLANGALKSNPTPRSASPSPWSGEGKQENEAGKTSFKQMSFKDMSKILNDFGISISGKFVKDKDELHNVLNEYGEGPYAMKIISANIVHKTDVGAVKLNISNLNEANLAWQEMENKIKEKNQGAEIEGVLVQLMIKKGREVIIGMKRDITFGPAILFGLGGILAEAIKDTTLRVAPIEKAEALKMMQEIKGIKILQGMRGEPPVNFDALAEIIENLSRLALAHPEIKEIDLNPVICSDATTTIVDARIMT